MFWKWFTFVKTWRSEVITLITPFSLAQIPVHFLRGRKKVVCQLVCQKLYMTHSPPICATVCNLGACGSVLCAITYCHVSWQKNRQDLMFKRTSASPRTIQLLHVSSDHTLILGAQVELTLGKRVRAKEEAAFYTYFISLLPATPKIPFNWTTLRTYFCTVNQTWSLPLSREGVRHKQL